MYAGQARPEYVPGGGASLSRVEPQRNGRIMCSCGNPGCAGQLRGKYLKNPVYIRGRRVHPLCYNRMYPPKRGGALAKKKRAVKPRSQLGSSQGYVRDDQAAEHAEAGCRELNMTIPEYVAAVSHRHPAVSVEAMLTLACNVRKQFRTAVGHQVSIPSERRINKGGDI